MHCLDLSSRIRVSPRGTGGAPVDHTVLTACLYACPPVRLSACSPHIFPPRKTIKGDLLTFSLLASYPCSGDGLAGQGSAFRGLGYSVQTGRPEIFAQYLRRLVLHAFPDAPNVHISQRVGALWRGLESPLRDQYANEAKRLADLHAAEFPDYKYQPRKRQRGGGPGGVGGQSDEAEVGLEGVDKDGEMMYSQVGSAGGSSCGDGGLGSSTAIPCLAEGANVLGRVGSSFSRASYATLTCTDNSVGSDDDEVSQSTMSQTTNSCSLRQTAKSSLSATASIELGGNHLSFMSDSFGLDPRPMDAASCSPLSLLSGPPSPSTSYSGSASASASASVSASPSSSIRSLTDQMLYTSPCLPDYLVQATTSFSLLEPASQQSALLVPTQPQTLVRLTSHQPVPHFSSHGVVRPHAASVGQLVFTPAPPRRRLSVTRAGNRRRHLAKMSTSLGTGQAHFGRHFDRGILEASSHLRNSLVPDSTMQTSQYGFQGPYGIIKPQDSTVLEDLAANDEAREELDGDEEEEDEGVADQDFDGGYVSPQSSSDIYGVRRLGSCIFSRQADATLTALVSDDTEASAMDAVVTSEADGEDSAVCDAPDDVSVISLNCDNTGSMRSGRQVKSGLSCHSPTPTRLILVPRQRSHSGLAGHHPYASPRHFSGLSASCATPLFGHPQAGLHHNNSTRAYLQSGESVRRGGILLPAGVAVGKTSPHLRRPLEFVGSPVSANGLSHYSSDLNQPIIVLTTGLTPTSSPHPSDLRQHHSQKHHHHHQQQQRQDLDPLMNSDPVVYGYTGDPDAALSAAMPMSDEASDADYFPTYFLSTPIDSRVGIAAFQAASPLLINAHSSGDAESAFTPTGSSLSPDSVDHGFAGPGPGCETASGVTGAQSGELYYLAEEPTHLSPLHPLELCSTGQDEGDPLCGGEMSMFPRLREEDPSLVLSRSEPTFDSCGASHEIPVLRLPASYDSDRVPHLLPSPVAGVVTIVTSATSCLAKQPPLLSRLSNLSRVAPDQVAAISGIEKPSSLPRGTAVAGVANVNATSGGGLSLCILGDSLTAFDDIVTTETSPCLDDLNGAELFNAASLDVEETTYELPTGRGAAVCVRSEPEPMRSVTPKRALKPADRLEDTGAQRLRRLRSRDSTSTPAVEGSGTTGRRGRMKKDEGEAVEEQERVVIKEETVVHLEDARLPALSSWMFSRSS